MLRFVLLTLLLGFSVLPVDAQYGPRAQAYDLGTATIIDPALGDLTIPVTLQGALALPQDATPAPLVLVLHGRHAMCGVNIAIYPCEPGAEIRYDLGFAYLLESLADHGYAALAINLNAAMTEAYGRGDINTRAEQLVALHLEALRRAASGASDFPIALEGRIDFARSAAIGHSSGGGAALQIARALAGTGEDRDIDALLLVAAAYNGLGPEGLPRSADELFSAYAVPSDVPMATILPDCDGDQISFWTQIAYEAARRDPTRTRFAASIRVLRANHNHFNTAVERGDRRFGYPPCFAETTDIMPRAEQEQFLIEYARAFLDAALGDPTGTIFDPASDPPAVLYGTHVQTNLIPGAAERLSLIALPGVTMTPSNSMGIMTCTVGESCLGGITVAGRFGFLRLTWSGRSGLTLNLPAEYADISGYDSLHLRVVPDYTSALNVPGVPLALTLTLLDADGSETEVALNDEAVFTVPPPAEFYGYSPFMLYPASLRIPLTQFEGIDLSRVVAITLRSTETPGALLLADLDLFDHVSPGT